MSLALGCVTGVTPHLEASDLKQVAALSSRCQVRKANACRELEKIAKEVAAPQPVISSVHADL